MLTREAINGYLPHGERFTFIDAAAVEGRLIKGNYAITGEECFAGAHFPGRFVFPASIMVEAIGQLGIVYMFETMGEEGLDPESIFFISSEDVSCRRQCFPGEKLEMSLRLIRKREPLIVFSGAIEVAGQPVLKVSSLTLSFSTRFAS
jgi:3-hydroxyacyl-[acyl-carrier-protein] dehydratase